MVISDSFRLRLSHKLHEQVPWLVRTYYIVIASIINLSAQGASCQYHKVVSMIHSCQNCKQSQRNTLLSVLFRICQQCWPDKLLLCLFRSSQLHMLLSEKPFHLSESQYYKIVFPQSRGWITRNLFYVTSSLLTNKWTKRTTILANSCQVANIV
jgi:hypothetical protein